MGRCDVSDEPLIEQIRRITLDQIRERRSDPDFKARLLERLAADQKVLDRLRDDAEGS